MIAMARVLLVEDEEALSRLISWSLLDAGHEVGVVATPAAAVERLSTYRADVIVFNTVIAHDAKDAWMARIRETATEARILDVSDEKNARASGIIGASRDGASADGSLDLPFPEARLLKEIDRLLAVKPGQASRIAPRAG